MEETWAPDGNQALAAETRLQEARTIGRLQALRPPAFDRKSLLEAARSIRKIDRFEKSSLEAARAVRKIDRLEQSLLEATRAVRNFELEQKGVGPHLP